MPRLHEFFGGSRHGLGDWTLPPLGDEQASRDGALYIGPSQIILETAAMDVAHEHAGTDQLHMQAGM